MPPSAKKPKQTALNRIRDAFQEKSLVLDLSGLRIEQVPSSLGQLTQLTTLDLNANQLTTLSEVLGRLTLKMRARSLRNDSCLIRSLGCANKYIARSIDIC